MNPEACSEGVTPCTSGRAFAGWTYLRGATRSFRQLVGFLGHLVNLGPT